MNTERWKRINDYAWETLITRACDWINKKVCIANDNITCDVQQKSSRFLLITLVDFNDEIEIQKGMKVK
jgi:hypothetical protein